MCCFGPKICCAICSHKIAICSNDMCCSHKKLTLLSPFDHLTEQQKADFKEALSLRCSVCDRTVLFPRRLFSTHEK